MKHEDFDFKNPALIRKLAEEKLMKNKSGKSGFAEEADIRKLVHELQVHQIELEMQNEELHLAYEAAEEALKKYTLLYDLAPLSYFVVNKESRIKELNFTAAEILGERRFTLIDNNFRLFIMEESLTVFDDFLAKIYVSKAKESCQIKLGYHERLLATVYMEGSLTGEEDRCLLSVIDISKFSRKGQ